MKVQIAMPDYSFMCLTSSIPEADGESWKNPLDEDAERLRNRGCITYANIELPYPLGSATAVITRTDAFYAVRFILIARNPTVFQRISPALEKEFKGDNIKFYPTTPNGTGHFVDCNGSLTATIYEYAKDHRIVCLGQHGSYPRRLDGLEKFVATVKECESISTKFLNILIGRKGINSKYTLPEQSTLYLMF